MLTRRNALTIVLAAMALVGTFTAPAPAAGSLAPVASIRADDRSLDVDTYTEGTQRVALVSIVMREKRIVFAFDTAEWRTFSQLWKTAAARDGEMQPVGEMNETGTKDPTHLELSAGGASRFVLSSPALGSLQYDLRKPDYAAFDAAVEKVSAYLNG